MKKILATLTFTSSIFFTLTSHINDYINIPFNTSMQTTSPLYTKKYNKPGFNQNFIARLRQLYNKNNITNLTAQSSPRIPLIIHQIWVGPKPLPEFYAKLAQTWKELHPDWTYILWTDKEVKELKLYNQKFYDRTKSYSEKANILRLELLARYGGVYIDIDFECLKPLDVLHYYYDSYTGIAPNKSNAVLANGIMGSVPRHPFLNDLIVNMHKASHGRLQVLRNGVLYISTAFHNYLGKTLKNKPETIDIALPATYFYPFNKNLGEPISNSDFIRPESFAIHYWGTSLEQKMNLYNQKR